MSNQLANTSAPRKFVMQQVFELLLRKPADKSILAYLTDVKTSGLENTVEMVYPTGGRGNSYIGNGFAHSKRASLNVSVATWNTDVLAMQNGTEVYTGSSEVTKYEVKAFSGTTATTEFKAQGTAGAEIGFVYPVKEDGTYGTPLEQATSASDGKFSYDATTKTITFADSESLLDDVDYIAFSYTFKTNDKAEKITVTTDGIPSRCLVTAYGLASDVCTGLLYPAVIEGNAQVDGNWAFDVSADGEPAVHDLKMEFVKGCLDKDLYTFIIHTDEEATD